VANYKYSRCRVITKLDKPRAVRAAVEITTSNKLFCWHYPLKAVDLAVKGNTAIVRPPGIDEHYAKVIFD